MKEVTLVPRQLKTDPSRYGLLKKLVKAEKVGTICILHDILPVLSDLIKVFQHGTINFGHIHPSIPACKDKLLALATKKVPIKRLQSDLAEGGSLAFTDIKKYVDALIKNISKRFRDAAQVLTAM
ncbi:unnamed protein product [Porites lobata]|uniref:Uncharacterized protein n=1 Tax=Porites lobata TaxID=104759 RepID=A0ABN8QCP1_9CNID|nr:unnamed protein product [Porites lobata]